MDYRIGDIYIPKLEAKTLLGTEKDFVNVITTDTIPICDYNLGLSVVKIFRSISDFY